MDKLKIYSHRQPFPWMLYGAELIGTGLLVAVGLSIVIVSFGQGSPIIQLIPSAGWRRLIAGFLFGTTGALIALSPLGKESGAHINPAVTFAFWLLGKIRKHHAIGYVLAQMIGATLGAAPLLAWGAMGRSIDFGATLPSPFYGAGWALFGETVTTFCLIFGLFFFLQHRYLKKFTPALFPFLYAVMVLAEANISGTSTNPARSFGPALISGNWQAGWVYWVGPLMGVLLGVGTYLLTSHYWSNITVAKLYHFEHDRYGIFHF
ncbi:MAG: aquaporin [Methylophilaceae bacterium]